MQLASLGDLHGCAELVPDRLGKRFAGVAAVDENAGDLLEVVRAAIKRGQGALVVGDLGCGDGHRMRQASRVHRDVALDAGDLLARVLAFLAGGIGVLHALRVHDQEAGPATAPLSGAGLAN